MKNLIFLTVMFLFVRNGNAQNVTIGHESAPVVYYRMPDEPLDPSYKTYSVEISTRTGELMRTGLTEGSLENEFLTLAGYEKVFNNGDVHIEATIGEFNVSGERRGSQQSKSKDKNGNEITRTSYYIELRYAQPLAFRVTDKKGKTLGDEYVYRWSDDQTWRSSNYSSMSDLDRYWRSNRTYKLADLQKSRIRQGMQVMSDRINNLFGYRLIRENERFEKIGKKRHPFYAQYDGAVETIKKAFKLMDADKSLVDVKKSVQPAIEFYKTADANCKPVDKDAMKLKHIHLYNLGLLYFWLEEFAEARKYTEAIYLFDDKDKDAKRLLEQIDSVESSLRKANRKSRHQVVIGGKA